MLVVMCPNHRLVLERQPDAAAAEAIKLDVRNAPPDGQSLVTVHMSTHDADRLSHALALLSRAAPPRPVDIPALFPKSMQLNPKPRGPR